jgi:hypothetical protein
MALRTTSGSIIKLKGLIEMASVLMGFPCFTPVADVVSQL